MFCFPITISVTHDCVFGFLFREACAHVVPSVGLSMGKLCPQEGVESKWLLVARDRFDRQHQQNMSFSMMCVDDRYLVLEDVNGVANAEGKKNNGEFIPLFVLMLIFNQHRNRTYRINDGGNNRS